MVDDKLTWVVAKFCPYSTKKQGYWILTPSLPSFPQTKIIWKVSLFSKQMISAPKKKAFLSKAFPECSDQAKSPKRVCQGVRERGESYCWAPHWHQHGWSPGFLGTLPPPPQAERTTFLPMELIASFSPTPTSPLKNKNKSSCSESRPATLETLAYAGKQPDG